uniref:Uncharacterized protein n=1 Tax=Anguilla anguilla TaxID=7936 RepID=A0A0E9W632_ANGAN
MKFRILNSAAHVNMCYLWRLCSISFVFGI